MTWNRMKEQWPATPQDAAGAWGDLSTDGDSALLGREDILAWLREAEGPIRDDADPAGEPDGSITGHPPFDVREN